MKFIAIKTRTVITTELYSVELPPDQHRPPPYDESVIAATTDRIPVGRVTSYNVEFKVVMVNE